MQDQKQYLDDLVDHFNRPSFIPADPIALPHQFNNRADIEIIGFWVATLAWGNRATILNKGRELIELMDGAPHDFILNHEEADRARFESWKHRTFQYLDTLYFLEFLQHHYRNHVSLESAFARHLAPDSPHVGPALRGFHEEFFSLPHAPRRTRKHVATPARNSRCKRLSMFLRWMVRQDDRGVDFGLWTGIRPDQLLMPLDVHVERVARRLGLLQRKQCDWRAVLELTDALRRYDPADPVRYDFALFGLGVLEGKKGTRPSPT